MRTIKTFHQIHIVKRAGAFETEALPPHQIHHVTEPPAANTAGWKSPIPYLFGGLAAMLGLIAFALLILGCSYWKLSGNFDENSDNEESDEKGKKNVAMKASVFEQSVLVIMAGEDKPTFLAMPQGRCDCCCPRDGGGVEEKDDVNVIKIDNNNNSNSNNNNNNNSNVSSGDTEP